MADQTNNNPADGNDNRDLNAPVPPGLYDAISVGVNHLMLLQETPPGVEYGQIRIPHDWRFIPGTGSDALAQEEISQFAQICDFVQRLPRIPLSVMDDEDTDCSICMEPYARSPPVAGTEENESALMEEPVKLPCGHIFGHWCILAWLTDHSTTCPVCRRRTIFFRPSRLILRFSIANDDYHVRLPPTPWWNQFTLIEGNNDYTVPDGRSDIRENDGGDTVIWRHTTLTEEVRGSESRRSSGSASMDISEDDSEGWDMEEAASTNDNEL